MKKAIFYIVLFAMILLPATGIAADGDLIPGLSISIGNGAEGGTSTAIQIVILLTVLSLVPSILIMMTSFTRLIIVFALLRQAVGVQYAPPNQVVVGMALFLTFFIMFPTFKTMNEQAFGPYRDGDISQSSALAKASEPLKAFMLKNVRKKDLRLFMDITGEKKIENKEAVPFHVLVPAFVTSELKTAFQIGFLIYLPFLVIDMVVASVLMSMGMMMLPPVMISLPFKLMLFVLADGWYLLVGSLVRSFG
ncbi:Flagellar biosynthesis protein FliP [hydrothermal vent metagenome]|uniref:Flagellar biosynthetic protein FliP n=1 Tax=hydrothermal vent metagenome TaxID=652676 RepID=A0A3B0V8V3_9ZZZZ